MIACISDVTCEMYASASQSTVAARGWPTMRSDVTKWYEACPVCELSKAARNKAHGRFRAVQPGPPRSRWGMDYYGVGDGHVLGLIDLDSRWVELAYHDNRSAALTADTIRERILHRHGTPAEIRSDHAREFIGSILTLLAQTEGYMRTTTGGYSATGNATIERFWRFCADAPGVPTWGSRTSRL